MLFFSMVLKDKKILLLKQRLEDLQVSPVFVQKCHQMGYYSLKEILDQGWVAITKKKSFTYRWLGELMQLLEREDLEDLFEAIPETVR